MVALLKIPRFLHETRSVGLDIAQRGVQSLGSTLWACSKLLMPRRSPLHVVVVWGERFTALTLQSLQKRLRQQLMWMEERISTENKQRKYLETKQNYGRREYTSSMLGGEPSSSSSSIFWTAPAPNSSRSSRLDPTCCASPGRFISPYDESCNLHMHCKCYRQFQLTTQGSFLP